MSTPEVNGGLDENLTKLEESAKRLNKASKRFGIWRSLLIFLCLAAGGLSIGLNIWLSIQTHTIVKGVLDIGKSNKANTDLLIDCTTPNHTCYERGRSATSGAVGTISKIAIAVVYCDNRLGPKVTYIRLQDCVYSLTKP